METTVKDLLLSGRLFLLGDKLRFGLDDAVRQIQTGRADIAAAGAADAAGDAQGEGLLLVAGGDTAVELAGIESCRQASMQRPQPMQL